MTQYRDVRNISIIPISMSVSPQRQSKLNIKQKLFLQKNTKKLLTNLYIKNGVIWEREIDREDGRRD